MKKPLDTDSNDKTSGAQLSRQRDDPTERVVPAHGESPTGVNESSRVDRERALDGEDDREFAEGVDDHEQHDTDQEETDED